ncbi:MAG: DUF2075 domain-containing protein [Metamycoplasmataceae bacterium]
MIIYENSKNDFISDVRKNLIVTNIKNSLLEKGLNINNQREIQSWHNSLQFVGNILDDIRIANDCQIAIEYKIPFTSNRIDLIICGKNDHEQNNVLIIELKQWSKVEISERGDYVKTWTGGGNREVLHPSFQAKTYKYLLESFNSAIELEKIKCNAVAYLHNAEKKINIDLVNLTIFSYVNDFPIYFTEDFDLLQQKIISLVGKGKGKEILYYIENGKIKPSKKLIDVVADSIIDKPEFILVDSQKNVYENILLNVDKENNVYIVNGNPGTGKSVVALNILTALLSKEKTVQYVAPNSSFKNAIIQKLKEYSKNNKYKDSISTLFKGGAGFINIAPKTFDWIIVDEGHRLKKCENNYSGNNQIDDILKAGKNVIFFIDERQMLSNREIGSNKNIIDSCLKNKMNYYQGEDYHLKTQFRCIGADGYINALDNILQIEETANYYLNENKEYEIVICDSPQQMEDLINQKIEQGFINSKIVAGYAWPWKSKNLLEDKIYLKENHDIYIEEFDWSIPWNFSYANSLWLSKSKNKRQAGCVHTIQGLELDYCAVIIGDDLLINENNKLYANYQNYYDKVGKANYRGNGTKSLKEDNEELTRLIKNIYKVLLSRGQKGTFIFATNPEIRKYLKKFINN